MDDHHSIYCSICKASDHHTIECIEGGNAVNYQVMPFSRQDDCQTTTTQEASSTGDDLIDLEDVTVSPATESSHTDYLNDLRQVQSAQSKPEDPAERSPVAPNYDARLKEDMEEAIRRSLLDLKDLHITSGNTEVSCALSKVSYHTANSERVLSDGEDFEFMKKVGTSKAMEWNDGDENTVTAIQVKQQQKQKVREEQNEEDDDIQWFTRATPKTLQNIKMRGFKTLISGQGSGVNIKTQPDEGRAKGSKSADVAPKSSLLAMESSGSGKKGRSRARRARRAQRSYAEVVTRAPNTEADTVNVSGLQMKRQGRGNRHSYYDITSELQYLR